MSGHKTAGSGASTNVQKSLIPGAITMSQDEHYFVKEMAFTQSARYIFSSDETKWFLINPTNYTPDTEQEFGRIILQIPEIDAIAGPMYIDFYGSPSLGVAVPTPVSPPPFNRIGSSSRVAQLEISQLNVAPSVSLGTLFSQLLLPATAAGVGQQNGASTARSLPFGLDANVPILMTVLNKDGNLTDAGIRLGWFEI